MEEAFDRCAIAVASAVMPYSHFSNPAVMNFHLCMGELRSITNQETYHMILKKMSGSLKQQNRVESIETRFKKVKSISNN